MNSKEVILFYKVLEAPGGAERLLFHEYEEFKKMGFRVYVVTYKYHESAFFSKNIESSDLVVLGGRGISSILRLRSFLRSKKGALVLGSSGHLDLYLATCVSGLNYSLHIHHPSYMSFNEYDKYSVFQIKHFKTFLNSNHGASRFKEIYESLNVLDKIKLNVRAAISILAIKSAQNIFVLSEYAKKEKKVLFGVESHVVCGALEESALLEQDYKPCFVYQGFDNKFLTIARLDINKRIDVLIEAFDDFLKAEPNSVLVVGGEGEEKERLISLAERLGISENIKFLGFVKDSDLYALYSGADVFVSIDWADYRITAYEALAVGTKVMLSNETDFGRDLTESGYLKLVDPTKESTASALISFIKEKPAMDLSSLKLNLESLTWKNFCARLLDIMAVRK